MRIANLRPLYIYTRVIHVCTRPRLHRCWRGINFLERLQILLTKGAEFPIKRSGRSVRAFFLSMLENIQPERPTNNIRTFYKYVRFSVRPGIYLKSLIFTLHRSILFLSSLQIVSSSLGGRLFQFFFFFFFFSFFFLTTFIFFRYLSLS